MAETLLDKPLPWLNGAGTEPELVLWTGGVLLRNLADLPFPHRCSEEERRTAEERILGAIEGDAFRATGQYCPLSSLDTREILFLQERGLLAHDRAADPAFRGVFVCDDQSASILINSSDHVRIQAYAAGLDPDRVWTKLNALDDMLGQGLDYAFDEKLGYLTRSTGTAGTGLVLQSVLHLPALAMSNQMQAIEQRLLESRHALRPFALRDDVSVQADLYALRNTATLGRSEQEIVFHLAHEAASLIASEKDARKRLLAESPRGIEDRVCRARGIAREARLLESGEAAALVSSLRLGVASGLIEGVTIRQLNEALMALRRGHLEMRLGQDSDDLALSAGRADLFRRSFS